jgi:hypothetical protein
MVDVQDGTAWTLWLTAFGLSGKLALSYPVDCFCKRGLACREGCSLAGNRIPSIRRMASALQSPRVKPGPCLSACSRHRRMATVRCLPEVFCWRFSVQQAMWL